MTDWNNSYTGAFKRRCKDRDAWGCSMYRFLPFLSLRVALYAGIFGVIFMSLLMTRESQRLRELYQVTSCTCPCPHAHAHMRMPTCTCPHAHAHMHMPTCTCPHGCGSSTR